MAEVIGSDPGGETPVDRAQLNVVVPERFIRLLRQIAEKDETTMGAVVNLALETIIAKNAGALLELSEERCRLIDEDASAELTWLERMAHERAGQQATTED